MFLQSHTEPATQAIGINKSKTSVITELNKNVTLRQTIKPCGCMLDREAQNAL
jgi:hypothetical protein